MKSTFRIINIVALICWPLTLLLNFVGLGIIPEVLEKLITALLLLRRLPDLIKMVKNPKIIATYAISFIGSSLFAILPWDFFANLFVSRIYTKQQTQEQQKAQQATTQAPHEYKRAA